MCIASVFQRNFWEDILNIYPQFVFVLLTMMVPLLFQEDIAFLLDTVLRKFRVGGDIPAVIVDTKSGNFIAKGRLLFYTTKNYYFKVNARDNCAVVENYKILCAENDKNQGMEDCKEDESQEFLRIIKNESDYELDICLTKKYF
jgi:hypothetical protein